MLLHTASLLAFLLVACTVPCHAARPLQTDDAGVLAPRDCEIEGATQRLSAAGQAATETGVQLGCGVGWDSQLAVAAAAERAEGERTSSLAISGKTGLWKSTDKDDASGLALSWQLLSSKVPGGAWRHTETSVNLLWSMPLATHHTLHVNLGHSRQEVDKRRATTWGLGFEHAGLGGDGRWIPVAELYGDDRERPWWNLGLRLVAVPDKLFVALSYGRQWTQERPTLITLSLKAAF
jgi:hypothetical protein